VPTKLLLKTSPDAAMLFAPFGCSPPPPPPPPPLLLHMHPPTHLHTPTTTHRRLSIEVDQLLSELPTSPPSVPTHAFTLPTRTSHAYTLPTRTSHTSTLPSHSLPANTTLTGSLQKLQVEEQELQSQVNQLTDKRDKLAHELSDLMSHVSIPLLPPHTRTLSHSHTSTNYYCSYSVLGEL